LSGEPGNKQILRAKVLNKTGVAEKKVYVGDFWGGTKI